LAVPALASALPAARLGDAPIGPILDDRLNIEPGDATLLIVEDDPHYARIVADLAHDKGLKVVQAMRGADALALARDIAGVAGFLSNAG